MRCVPLRLSSPLAAFVVWASLVTLGGRDGGRRRGGHAAGARQAAGGPLELRRALRRPVPRQQRQPLGRLAPGRTPRPHAARARPLRRRARAGREPHDPRARRAQVRHDGQDLLQRLGRAHGPAQATARSSARRTASSRVLFSFQDDGHDPLAGAERRRLRGVRRPRSTPTRCSTARGTTAPPRSTASGCGSTSTARRSARWSGPARSPPAARAPGCIGSSQRRRVLPGRASTTCASTPTP